MFAHVVVLLVPALVSTRSLGEEISSPLFEPTPAVKKPSDVVRPLSHVRSFGGHCCPVVVVPCLRMLPSTLCIGCSCEWCINYVYLCISSPCVNPNINSTPVPECQSSGPSNTLSAFGWSGTRVTCEMVSDGGGRFIPAVINSWFPHIIFVTCVPGST